jgi:hypothetical protein
VTKVYRDGGGGLANAKTVVTNDQIRERHQHDDGVGLATSRTTVMPR